MMIVTLLKKVKIIMYNFFLNKLYMDEKTLVKICKVILKKKGYTKTAYFFKKNLKFS